jgi:hypothetical protein
MLTKLNKNHVLISIKGYSIYIHYNGNNINILLVNSYLIMQITNNQICAY